jgi:hypothetical protein
LSVITRSTTMPRSPTQATARRKESDRGDRVLALEHLDVGQPGVIIHADVDELPAGQAALEAGDAVAALQSSRSGHAMASGEDPAELLDVDVHQLAGATTLLAVRRLRRREP